jgi:hypothetical protein
MPSTGGQYAIKGFVYQTIATVLHALVESPWELLTVEPPTDNEKVDMLWEDGTGRRKCQQVKSSIINFGKADLLRWLEEMVNDVPDALEYELILIGNRNDSVNEFINKVNSRTSTDLSPALTSLSDRLRLEMLVDSADVLQGHVQNEVHRFLSKYNYHPSYDTIVLITGGLLYQFFQFALVGTQASKAAYTEKLLQWTTTNYQRGLHLAGRQDRLSIGIYQQDQRTIVQSSQPFRCMANAEDWIDLTEAHEHFTTAARIHLPALQKKPEVTPAKDIPLLAIPEFTSLWNFAPVVIEDWEKTWFSEKIREYLFQSTPSDFFQMGNLKEKHNFPGPFTPWMDYEGSEDEKAKYSAIRQLRWAFRTLDELKSTIEFINRLFYLPLVLENVGGSFDEDVRVMLKIPESVNVITTSEFHVPENIDVLKLLTVEKPLARVLSHGGDSFVMPYPRDVVTETATQLSESTMFLFSGGRELEIRQERFVDSLGTLFNRELFDDLPGFKQIQYTFSEINPNMRLSFPAHLFFEAAKSFTIKYEISSRNTATMQNGNLICNLDADEAGAERTEA